MSCTPHPQFSRNGPNTQLQDQPKGRQGLLGKHSPQPGWAGTEPAPDATSGLTCDSVCAPQALPVHVDGYLCIIYKHMNKIPELHSPASNPLVVFGVCGQSGATGKGMPLQLGG